MEAEEREGGREADRERKEEGGRRGALTYRQQWSEFVGTLVDEVIVGTRHVEVV